MSKIINDDWFRLQTTGLLAKPKYPPMSATVCQPDHLSTEEATVESTREDKNVSQVWHLQN